MQRISLCRSRRRPQEPAGGAVDPVAVVNASAELVGSAPQSPNRRAGTGMSEPTHRIVVGVDGSPASIDALKWAGRQASLTGAAVEPVIAWQCPLGYGGYSSTADVDWQGRREVIPGHRRAPGSRFAACRGVSRGHRGTAGEGGLIDAAAGADLLVVVGNRGRGDFVGIPRGRSASTSRRTRPAWCW